MRDTAERVTLVDATFTDYLRTLGDQTLAGFSLSNICEWLDTDGIDALFAEVARTARRGAIVCFRNFVGWTEVPERWRRTIVEDRARGEKLFARDRALVNRRFAICRVVGS
jgi:S-adenosylmethionine-diacylglycerol 3-amino-3-carboxypropyl transferase